MLSSCIYSTQMSPGTESHIALLLGTVLQEGVHQLGVNQVPSPKTIKDSMSAVMSDAAEHSETGDQHSVVVVTK